MLFRKDEITPDVFWQEYEEKTGEKVLARGLGKYVSGWQEFDETKARGIWGLVINTTGGFRFHHFPQNSWMDSLTRFDDKGRGKERTIFIPKENIISTETIKETIWWKKLLFSPPPYLVINYTDKTAPQGEIQRLVFEAEYTGGELP